MVYKFTTPFVVSFGEEEFFLDRDLQWFKDQPSRTVTVVDGHDIKEPELLSLCDTYTIDFDDPTNFRSRLVILDNGNKIKWTDKALKAYIEAKRPSDTTSVLAVIVRDSKLPAFWAKVSKATVREYKKLKTWDNNNEVIKWIQEESTRIGLRLDAKLSGFVYQIVGADLYRISSELQKLLLLVGTAEAVTVEHLKLILSPGSTVEPFHVAEAAANKDSKKALNALSSLYKYAAEDPSIPVAYALMKQVERLFVARSLLDKGATSDDVSARLNMHPWRCKNFFIPQVEKHTQSKLLCAMRQLTKLDVEIKRTSHSKRTLLELAVLAIAS